MTGLVRTLPSQGGPTSCAVWFSVDVHTSAGWMFFRSFHETPRRIAEHVDAITEKGLGEFTYRPATAAEIASEVSL